MDLVKLALIILIACVLVSVTVLVVGDDSRTATSSFFLGPFTSLRRVGNIIEAASPFMFTALVVIIIFGSGQLSMIAEGSFFIDITGAMIVAIVCKLSGGIHPAVAILFGGFYGALAALVPASPKMKWDVNELVTPAMFNYVMQFFAIYMVSYHFHKVSSSSLASLEFEKTSKFLVILDRTRIRAGVVLGVVLCILMWSLLYRTSLGIKLKITGDSPLFTKYANLKVTGLTVAAQVIAGATAGMGGGAELLGVYNWSRWTTVPGHRWTSIVVALLARSNPLLVPLAAAFIGYLDVRTNIMTRSSDVDREVVDIIQGIIMFLIVADTLLEGWGQCLIVKAAKAKEKEAMQT